MPTPLEFLFATWEGGGHVTPAFWAAKRLVDRGHRVTVLSDQASAAEAESFGLDFRAWRRAPNRPDKAPRNDPLKDWEAATPAEMVQRLCDRLLVGPADAYAADVLDQLQDRPGAVVVSHELLLGAMMAAESQKAPLALLTSNVWPYPTLDQLPPFGPGLPPPADAEARQFQDLIRRGAQTLYEANLPPLNAVRRALGLGALSSLFQQLDAADLILFGTSRAFDFPATLPERFRYAGPQVRVPHWAAEAWRSPWNSEDDRPLVLISFSTLYQEQEPVLRRVIEALGRLPVRGLVTLGPAIPLAAFTQAPENVVVVESISHDSVMPSTAACVTHGGHGAVIRPLLHGVPLLCMPMGRDQPENAARVTERGAGLRLEADAPVEAIAASVLRLLQEPSFRAGAKALGDAIRRAQEEDGDIVVQELERLAQQGRDVVGGEGLEPPTLSV